MDKVLGTKNGQNLGQKIWQTFWKLLEVGGAGGTPLAVTQEDCLVLIQLSVKDGQIQAGAPFWGWCSWAPYSQSYTVIHFVMIYKNCSLKTFPTHHFDLFNRHSSFPSSFPCSVCRTYCTCTYACVIEIRWTDAALLPGTRWSTEKRKSGGRSSSTGRCTRRIRAQVLEVSRQWWE